MKFREMAALTFAALLLTGCAGGTVPAATSETSASSTSASASQAEPTLGEMDAWFAQTTDERASLMKWADEWDTNKCISWLSETCADHFREGQNYISVFSTKLKGILADAPGQTRLEASSASGYAVMALRSYESWTHACPSRSDCRKVTMSTEEGVTTLVDSIRDWPTP